MIKGGKYSARGRVNLHGYPEDAPTPIWTCLNLCANGQQGVASRLDYVTGSSNEHGDRINHSFPRDKDNHNPPSCFYTAILNSFTGNSSFIF